MVVCAKAEQGAEKSPFYIITNTHAAPQSNTVHLATSLAAAAMFATEDTNAARAAATI